MRKMRIGLKNVMVHSKIPLKNVITHGKIPLKNVIIYEVPAMRRKIMDELIKWKNSLYYMAFLIKKM
jgi:hypothetical protein